MTKLRLLLDEHVMTIRVNDSEGATMRKVVFLDRDGTLNVDSSNYIKSTAEFEWIEGVFEPLRRLIGAGYDLVLVTNQGGIRKGLMSPGAVEEIHRKLGEDLKREGIPILAVYFCPHHDVDGCDCRKPKPGMLFSAAAEHEIDLAASWMVGDQPRDIEAGAAAGCMTSLVGPERPLETVVDEILGTRARPLTDRDIPDLVRLHQEGFPGYFLTSLGPRFLANYYRAFLDARRCIGIALVTGNRIDGFVVGTVDPNFYLTFLRANFWHLPLLAPAGFKIVAQKPHIPLSVASKIFDLRSRARSMEAALGRVADLFSITVAAAGRGKGSGSRLLNEFIKHARRHGIQAIRLGAKLSEPQVIAFYRSHGFVPDREVADTRGNATIELLLPLSS